MVYGYFLENWDLGFHGMAWDDRLPAAFGAKFETHPLAPFPTVVLECAL